MTQDMKTVTIKKEEKEQTTKMIGCPAHMVVKVYHLYPDYQLTEEERHYEMAREIKALKKERHRKTIKESWYPLAV